MKHARPKQHIRHLRSGKKVLVNKGMLRKRYHQFDKENPKETPEERRLRANADKVEILEKELNEYKRRYPLVYRNL